MTISRRNFLAGSGAAALAGAIGLRPALAASGAATRPRFLVQFFLRGGFDAILTTDPKLRDQVDPGVDLPYDATQILDLGTHRIGPCFAQLREEVPAMAIVNAIDHGTVAHDYGLNNIVHMRRSYPVHHELGIGLAGHLGDLLSETPLNEAWLIGSPAGFPSFFPARKGLVMQDFQSADETLVARLSKVANGNGELASRVLGRELAACDASRTDCTSLKVVRDVLDRMRGVALPDPPKLTIALDSTTNADLAQKAASVWCNVARDSAYLLENDLTRTIYCAVPHAAFDTHQNNLPGQRRSCLVFAEGLKVFFEVLRRTSTKDGRSLFDQTGFVISSELGRNPFLNSAAGKDHFPHHPVIFMGCGIQPGQYGHTDRTMGGLPISPETGKDTASHATMLPNLDDVGATIFRWFGMDPLAAGYSGRPLEFVFRR